MKQPTKADFDDPQVGEAGVEIVFNPTNSHYAFNRLADPKDIEKYGPLSPDAHVRHAGPTRDTGDYSSTHVLAMAYRLASASAGTTNAR